MSVPDIHSCSRLSKENAALRRRIVQLKQAKDEVEGKLSVLLEKNKIDALLKSYCTTRDSSVQTEVIPWHARAIPLKQPSVVDVEKTNKLITMHAQLLKRYEKEVKQNVENTETISELTVHIANLERRLKEEQEKTFILEKQLMTLQSKQMGKTRTDGTQDGDPVLREVVQERNKLSKENRKLRQELKGLDKGFFDEVEDLKFALQQSTTLNKAFEQVLRKLCRQFGVSYPHPEKVLDAP